MKKILLIILMTAVSFMAFSQTKILLTVGDNTVTATLTDNTATRELLKLLESGPVTLNMNDYGGFEKVGTLPQSFPTSDSRITTSPGDIMLYQGNNLVIFYGTNTWSYTRIGRIDNATANSVKEFLGNGNISLTLSADPSSAITEISADRRKEMTVYDLRGNLVAERPLPSGLYIIDGKKTIVRE